MFHVYAFLSLKRFRARFVDPFRPGLSGWLTGGWLEAVNGDASETSLAEEEENSIRADLNSAQVNKAPLKVSQPVETLFFSDKLFLDMSRMNTRLDLVLNQFKGLMVILYIICYVMFIVVSYCIRIKKLQTFQLFFTVQVDVFCCFYYHEHIFCTNKFLD